MRQVVLYIPDDKYHTFIAHIKRKFTGIQIKEKPTVTEENIVAEEIGVYDTMRLSEKSLAEDWLSDEDSRWDKVL